MTDKKIPPPLQWERDRNTQQSEQFFPVAIVALGSSRRNTSRTHGEV